MKDGQRAITDPHWQESGGPVLKRVSIVGTAYPKKTFSVKLTIPKEPPDGWDPEDPETEDADLWTVTDTTIPNVRYGLPSGDELSEGTIGWILDDYYGRPVLILAECD